MTQSQTKERPQRTVLRLFAFLLLLVSVLLCRPIAEGIRRGLSLCAEVIVPSVLPSMLLAELLVHVSTGRRGLLSRLFSRLFHLPPAGALAFLLGALTGFPIGARISASLYERGELTKEEAQRLLAISANTGPAFLVAGIGIALAGDGRIGWMLYLVEMVGAILIGLCLGIGHRTRTVEHVTPPAPFRFVETVGACASRTLSLCAFVSLFCAIATLLETLLAGHALLPLLLSLLEIGTAASCLAPAVGTQLIALPLIAFAVGFSGLSVHAQTASVLKETDLNLRQFFICKLIQGGICFCLCPLACRLLGIG